MVHALGLGLGLTFGGKPASPIYTHGADNIGASGLTVPVLTLVTVDANARPQYTLANYTSPAVDDIITMTFNGVDYNKTLVFADLYDLSAAFNSIIPELANATYTVWAKITRGANYVYSNNADTTINVAYTAPAYTVDPVIAFDGTTFTTTTEPTVTGRLIPTVTSKWQRGGVDISPPQTGASYTKVGADDGTNITRYYTAVNASGTTYKASNAIAVPSQKLYFASSAGFSGGFPGTPLTINNVDFGTFTGTRRALIYVAYIRSNVPTALTVGGVSATLLGNQTNGSGYSHGLFAIDVTDGGTRTLVVTNADGNWSDFVYSIVTLDPSLNSTPTTVVNPAWNSSGASSVTFMPGTSVPTNGVQVAFSYWTVNSDASYADCTVENYRYFASGNEAFVHTLSSLNDVRMTGTRGQTFRNWDYIGAIFGP
jgi:hypothetical protein